MTDTRKSKEVTVGNYQSFAEIDSALEAKDVKRNDIVSAKVFCWDSTRQGLIVIFGKQLKGFIPSKHVSIYPSYNKNAVPSEAKFIIGKTIIAEVIDYNINKTEFILSRANAMNKRLDEIKTENSVIACVTKVRVKDIFFDVGSGVLGRVDCREISQSYVEDIADLGYYKGSLIPVKVIDIQNGKVNLSRKQFYPEYDMSMFNSGDVVEGRIVSELKTPLATDTCPYAYCLEIGDNPNVKGVMDCDMELSIGTTVTAVVKCATERGVRIKLSSI